MTAKEYLKQIRLFKYTIDNDLQRLEELKLLATATGSKELKQDVVQTSLRNAGLEDVVGDYVDFELMIRDEINEYLKLKSRIVGQINNLDAGERTANFVHLLLARYSSDMRFEQIALEMDYSYEHIRHMHKEALEAFEQQYRKEIDLCKQNGIAKKEKRQKRKYMVNF